MREGFEVIIMKKDIIYSIRINSRLKFVDDFNGEIYNINCGGLILLLNGKSINCNFMISER